MVAHLSDILVLLRTDVAIELFVHLLQQSSHAPGRADGKHSARKCINAFQYIKKRINVTTTQFTMGNPRLCLAVSPHDSQYELMVPGPRLT